VVAHLTSTDVIPAPTSVLSVGFDLDM
jgi:hypothetical protein